MRDDLPAFHHHQVIGEASHFVRRVADIEHRDFQLVVQPFVAYAVAHWILGVDGRELLAIVVVSALPTAQNIFVHATRYDTATGVARDTILLTTLGSVPAIVALALLLG